MSPRKKKVDAEIAQDAPEVVDDSTQPSDVKDESGDVSGLPWADESMADDQRTDIYLSIEWDSKDPVFKEKNNDKAAYMNEPDNRARALEAIKA